MEDHDQECIKCLQKIQVDSSSSEEKEQHSEESPSEKTLSQQSEESSSQESMSVKVILQPPPKQNSMIYQLQFLQEEVENLKKQVLKKDSIINILKKQMSEIQNKQKCFAKRISKQQSKYSYKAQNTERKVNENIEYNCKNQSEEDKYTEYRKTENPYELKRRSTSSVVKHEQKERKFKKTKKSNNRQISDHEDKPMQLSLLHEKIFKLESIIDKYEEDAIWMHPFIDSFVKMIYKLSYHFNQNFLHHDWPLKKKVKICWRYTKHLFHYFILKS